MSFCVCGGILDSIELGCRAWEECLCDFAVCMLVACWMLFAWDRGGRHGSVAWLAMMGALWHIGWDFCWWGRGGGGKGGYEKDEMML